MVLAIIEHYINHQVSHLMTRVIPCEFLTAIACHTENVIFVLCVQKTGLIEFYLCIFEFVIDHVNSVVFISLSYNNVHDLILFYELTLEK